MVTVVKAKIIFLLLFALQKEGYSFSFSFKPQRSTIKLNRLFQLNAKPLIDESKAIKNLEKLVERQRSELQNTENLLRALSSNATTYYQKEGNGFQNSSLTPLDVFSNLGLGVDYGFVSRSEGSKRGNMSGGLPVDGCQTTSPPFDGYGPPTNIIDLGVKAFSRNLQAIQGERTHEDEQKLSKTQKKLHAKLKQLTLNNTAIWEREEANNKVEAPLIIKIPYFFLCFNLDFVFDGKYVPSRFYLLETVARMPYFSYISMLHLYETLGWWRRSADVKRVHFAEEWNEFHHLLIMESIGGGQEWWVRFLALHAAIVYYWTLIALWMTSPSLAYKFSELLETHAVNTYSQLLDENEKILKELPASVAAIEYYRYGSSDPLFSEYQTSALAKGEEPRRPGDNMKTLYDVFSAIRDDEGDHVSTMKACLDPNVAVNSPSIEKQILVGATVVGAAAYFIASGDFVLDMELLDTTSDGIMSDLAGAAAIGEQLINDEEDSVFISQLFDGSKLNLDDLKIVWKKILNILFRIFG